MKITTAFAGKTRMTHLASDEALTRAPAKRNGRRVLIIVQNLPVPFDRRVWQEANELTANGYQVTIICPVGRGHEEHHEILNGISIFSNILGVYFGNSC